MIRTLLGESDCIQRFIVWADYKPAFQIDDSVDLETTIVGLLLYTVLSLR